MSNPSLVNELAARRLSDRVSSTQIAERGPILVAE
jgi:hypothetical protein